jgi:hypothetical protein
MEQEEQEVEQLRVEGVEGAGLIPVLERLKVKLQLQEGMEKIIQGEEGEALLLLQPREGKEGQEL